MTFTSGLSSYHSIAIVGLSGNSCVRLAWFQTVRKYFRVWLAADGVAANFRCRSTAMVLVIPLRGSLSQSPRMIVELLPHRRPVRLGAQLGSGEIGLRRLEEGRGSDLDLLAGTRPISSANPSAVLRAVCDEIVG